MTKRNANQVFDEIEVMKEQLKRTQYAFGTLVSEMGDLSQAMLAGNAKVLNQLTDTQCTLEYLKSYIGIDAFFDEAIRQGKGFSTARSMEPMTIEELKRSNPNYEAEKDT